MLPAVDAYVCETGRSNSTCILLIISLVPLLRIRPQVDPRACIRADPKTPDFPRRRSRIIYGGDARGDGGAGVGGAAGMPPFDRAWAQRFQSVTGDMAAAEPPDARTGALWDLYRRAPPRASPPPFRRGPRALTRVRDGPGTTGPGLWRGRDLRAAGLRVDGRGYWGCFRVDCPTPAVRTSPHSCTCPPCAPAVFSRAGGGGRAR